jgi:hypothetical protein
MKLARTEKRVIAAMLLAGVIGWLGFAGLRYEQQVETARYQNGFTDGIEIGALEARKKLLDQANCYPVVTMEADQATEEVICGVRMRPSDVENGALTRGNDLEQ